PAHPEEEEPAARGGHATDLTHATHLHDAPPAMALALIVLAIGSVLAGYASLGGRFERFLEPSFAPERVEEVADRGLELPLTAVSIAAALGGIAIAAYFFLKNRRAADRMA